VGLADAHQGEPSSLPSNDMQIEDVNFDYNEMLDKNEIHHDIANENIEKCYETPIHNSNTMDKEEEEK